MMFWTDHDLTGWGWAAMTISMLVFWALLITLTVVLVRALVRPAESPHGPSPRTGRGPHRNNCSPSGSPAENSTKRSTGAGLRH